MKLLVDNREPKDVLAILKSRLKDVEFGNLDIGDFIIKSDAGEIIMIFERKSLADLVASIKDGRYAEQSFRLSEHPIKNHNIFYIIEGNIMNFCNKNLEAKQKMVFSSMLSLSYKKGFSLLHTIGPIETVEFLIRFVEKLETEKPGSMMEGGENSYSNVVKIAKKSNITKENIGEIMLAQIPGLSINVAQAIMCEYKTMNNLIGSMMKDENCLDKFQVEAKNGKRKINKTVVEKLKEFLL